MLNSCKNIRINSDIKSVPRSDSKVSQNPKDEKTTAKALATSAAVCSFSGTASG
jgi:hypothetical protein